MKENLRENAIEGSNMIYLYENLLGEVFGHLPYLF